jgi:osmotically-inducible protein OsmY
MSNDKALSESVLAELAWEPSVTAGHIGATARDGVVTLTGHVSAFYQKHAAEAAARRVKGVKAVAEEIEVKLPLDVRRDDADIAQAAVTRLSWDASVPQNAIQIVVEKGWVTLTGEVEWRFQYDAAAKDIRTLFGVVGVSNAIKIKPRVDTANLKGRIDEALHRAWFDESNVRVTAEGGRVRLSGTVDSWNDRVLAGQTAWSAAGATSVENDLIIA